MPRVVHQTMIALLSGGRRRLAVLAIGAVLAAPAAIAAVQDPQEQFQPATQLGEQLPGAPFVLVAYALCWIAVLAYVFVLWRRLSRVQRELAVVQMKLGRKE